MAVTFAKVLTKVFGSRNERLLKRYQKVVDRINEFEPEMRAEATRSSASERRRYASC